MSTDAVPGASLDRRLPAGGFRDYLEMGIPNGRGFLDFVLRTYSLWDHDQVSLRGHWALSPRNADCGTGRRLSSRDRCGEMEMEVEDGQMRMFQEDL